VRHLGALAGKQHPQVLHAGPDAAVVEIDEVRPGIGP
jgi:hypothetical protein